MQNNNILKNAKPYLQVPDVILQEVQFFHQAIEDCLFRLSQSLTHIPYAVFKEG